MVESDWTVADLCVIALILAQAAMKLFVIALVIAICVLGSDRAYASTLEKSSGSLTLPKKAVTVYSFSPQKDTPELCVLEKGAVVSIQAKASNGWVKVHTGSGRDCFLPGDFVQHQAASGSLDGLRQVALPQSLASTWAPPVVTVNMDYQNPNPTLTRCDFGLAKAERVVFHRKSANGWSLVTKIDSSAESTGFVPSDVLALEDFPDLQAVYQQGPARGIADPDRLAPILVRARFDYTATDRARVDVDLFADSPYLWSRYASEEGWCEVFAPKQEGWLGAPARWAVAGCRFLLGVDFQVALSPAVNPITHVFGAPRGRAPEPIALSQGRLVVAYEKGGKCDIWVDGRAEVVECDTIDAEIDEHYRRLGQLRTEDPAPRPPPGVEVRAARLRADRSVLRRVDLKRLYAFSRMEMLGSGRSGVVYRVPRHKDGLWVACKFLQTQPSILHQWEKFGKEVDGMERVAGMPHVQSYIGSVMLFDPLQAMIFSEYICGQPLRQVCKGARKTHPDFAPIVLAQILIGLEHMHAAGVAHLDITPDNVMVTDSNEVTIIDFGASMCSRLGSPSTGHGKCGIGLVSSLDCPFQMDLAHLDWLIEDAFLMNAQLKRFSETFISLTTSEDGTRKCTTTKDLLLHPYICNKRILSKLAKADRRYIQALGPCKAI